MLMRYDYTAYLYNTMKLYLHNINYFGNTMLDTNKLPQFVSIEDIFPLWRMARPFIESAIPKQLVFVQSSVDQSRIEIDYSWADQLLTLTPPEDIDAMKDRLALVEEAISQAIPDEMFKEFLCDPIRPNTLSKFNAILANHYAYRIAEGQPSLTDLVQHAMGVSPVSGYKIRNIKATFSLGTTEE